MSTGSLRGSSGWARTTASNDADTARALKEEALTRFRELGDRSGEATTLFGLAISYMGTDLVRCRDYAEQALAVYRETGARKAVAQTLLYLASMLPGVEVETRIAFYTECREICREIGVTIWEATCLRRLAKIAEERGERERAASLRAEANGIFPELTSDPRLGEAFQKALKERDPDATNAAVERLLGSLKPREDGEASPG
jgi:hypothetical protein